MLDLGDVSDKTCNIEIILQNKKDVIITDCDGSDINYGGGTLNI